MSVKKKTQEGKIETSAEGILLREMLDAQIDLQAEDELMDAEALFKKSREEEQERIADFAEWIEDITRQSHPESEIEYDPMEPGPQIKAPTQLDVPTEMTPDFEVVSEADAVEQERERKEEKVENAD